MRTLGRTAVGHEPDVLAQQRKLADTKHVRPTVESVDDQQDRAHRQALLAKGGI
jgi:hypothetical protein